MTVVKKSSRAARTVGYRLVSWAGLASAGVLLASCASEPTSANPGQPMPVAFSGAAQCTSPLTMIPDQTATTGQLAGWAQACATKAQDSGLRATSSVNALQNAAKLYFAAGNYALAAENGDAAKRLSDSLPSSNSNANQDSRSKFDSAFVTIAPSLALGLGDAESNRFCGSKTACLTSGLEALEAVEFAAVRPILNDSTRYYQRAAVNLQTMNAKANAVLSQSGPDGNVDKSLSILKSIVSMVPAAGNEGLAQQATATLLDIAATVVDVTGAEHDEVSAALPGLSLRTIANSEDDPDRTIFSEYHDGGSITGFMMLREGGWKYIAYPGFASQLFDMEADPFETNDLGLTVEHASIRERLHQRMCREFADPDVINDNAFADQAQRIEELNLENTGSFWHSNGELLPW